MSKFTLWPTIISAPTNSRNLGRTDSMLGADSSIGFVMPVNSWINSSISKCGFTKDWNCPVSSPFWTFTAAISIISSQLGSSPVVSMSTTTYVVGNRSRLFPLYSLNYITPPPVPESGTIFYIFPQVGGNLTVSLLFSTTSCQKRCYGKNTRRCSGGVSSPAQAPSSVAGAAGPLYNGISGRSKIRVKRGT